MGITAVYLTRWTVQSNIKAKFFLLIVLATSSFTTSAHSPLSANAESRFSAIISALLLLSFWVIYTWGARRHKPPRWREMLFHFATVISALALLGPLDDWAKTSTAAHMTQHMLLMVVIAPLWVLSQPLPQIVAVTARAGALLWQPMLRLSRFPLSMAYLHAVVIWFWHTPSFYMLAVQNPWWHMLEHITFLMSAWLFWWAVLHNERSKPKALLAVLFTLMHTGFLGAILTFANTLLYGEARTLADQQLAGLLMWVLGAIPYLAVAAWLAYRWARQLQQHDATAPS